MGKNARALLINLLLALTAIVKALPGAAVIAALGWLTRYMGIITLESLNSGPFGLVAFLVPLFGLGFVLVFFVWGAYIAVEALKGWRENFQAFWPAGLRSGFPQRGASNRWPEVIQRTLVAGLMITVACLLPRLLPAVTDLQTQGLQAAVLLLALTVAWPVTHGQAVSSANMGARTFGLLALTAGLWTPTLWLQHRVPALVAAWPWWVVLSTVLIGGAMISLRMQEMKWVIDLRFRTVGVPDGDLNVRTIRINKQRVLVFRSAGKMYLATDSRAHVSGDTWTHERPERQRWRRRDILSCAQRLGAKPILMVYRGDLNAHRFPAETRLDLPYTVVFGDEHEIMDRIRELADMGSRVSSSPRSGTKRAIPSGLIQSDAGAQEAGLALERRSLAAARANLPAGWQMRQNVPLHTGGDADLELIRPDGRKFVIDIKLRRDDPQGNPKGTHAKTWPQLADQVTLAARQLGYEATPVLWQPEAPPRQRTASGRSQVLVLGGDVRTLYGALGRHP